jgi:hypothetical protein
VPRAARLFTSGRVATGLIAVSTAAIGLVVGLGTARPAGAAVRLSPASPVISGVHAAVPRLVRALPTAIEPPSPYIPQDDCDPTAKPGAIALMNLLLSTYRDSRSLGIVSTCAAEKMVSEHSDGRALDWGVSLSNAQQNREAQAVLTWLFAPDGNGNDQAMARRLGVMYVIWDGRIRSTGGDWQPYDASYCWKKGKVGGQRAGDVTQCHRNHIHISLAWDGALKKTSFWSGKVAPVDYGPCVPKGKKYASKYSKFNGTPCASGHGGTSTSKPKPTATPQPTVTPVAVWPTEPAPVEDSPTSTWPTFSWPTDDPSADPTPSTTPTDDPSATWPPPHHGH